MKCGEQKCDNTKHDYLKEYLPKVRDLHSPLPGTLGHVPTWGLAHHLHVIA